MKQYVFLGGCFSRWRRALMGVHAGASCKLLLIFILQFARHFLHFTDEETAAGKS